MKNNTDKWIQQIRQRMEEAPVPYDPSATWERMEEKIRNRERAVLHRKRILRVAGGWGIAVAAAVLLLLVLKTPREYPQHGVSFRYPELPGNIARTITLMPAEKPLQPIGTGLRSGSVTSQDTGSLAAQHADVALHHADTVAGPVMAEQVPLVQDISQVTDSMADIMVGRPEATPSEGRKKNRVMLSASGLLALQGSEQVRGMKLDNMFFQQSPALNYSTTPMVGISGKEEAQVFAPSTFIHYEYKHKLPVSFGMYAALSLNRKWSLESGVFATRLVTSVYSVIHETTPVFLTDQVLWYLGVPVKVRWNFINSRYVLAYVAAGGALEKCISFAYNPAFDREDMNFTARNIPLQWSVNASLGVQYSITQVVGLFAEPGVSLFFDSHAPVETIRQDKPLHFHLNAGIRFSF